MGNECDQCEAVTEGCRRQQFRTELKNRQKLDLSRGQTHEKSKSKLEAINNLRNNAIVQGSKGSQQQDDLKEQQSLQIIRNHKPPDEVKTKQQEQQQTQKKKQKKERSQARQQKNQSMRKVSNIEESNIYEDLKIINLPIQSGVDTKNNLKLSDLQRNLMLSRQPLKIPIQSEIQKKNIKKLENLQRNLLLSREPSKVGTQIEKKKTQEFNKNHKNSTIRIQESIHQSHYQESDKQNSIVRKNGLILMTESNIPKKQNFDLHQSNFLASSNPSKVLKQFNNQLQFSPIQKVNNQPKTPINHNNDSGVPYEESFTEPLDTVREEAFYIKPGVYFDGYLSNVNKKLQNEGAFIFQSDQTQLMVNFKNNRIDSSKNSILSFADGSAFQGMIKSQNSKSQFMACGQGKFVFPDSSYYVGQWLKNLPHGKGKHIFPDGSSYQGEFIQGRKQGKGKFSTAQKDLTYVGSFLNNRIEGQGQMTIIDPNTGKKRIYKGYFKNGKLEGEDCQAIYVDEQAKYIGAFENGKKCGYGRYYYGDGRIWEGQWRDNRQNGYGKFKNQKGVVIEGYWIDGIKNQYNSQK